MGFCTRLHNQLRPLPAVPRYPATRNISPPSHPRPYSYIHQDLLRNTGSSLDKCMTQTTTITQNAETAIHGFESPAGREGAAHVGFAFDADVGPLLVFLRLFDVGF
jgi:hypothetical protein